MKNWTNRLMTIIGVILILVAVYLFAKPYIDNYLHEKDNDDKIEQYDKMIKAIHQKKPTIPKDKSKMAGYISVPDAEIKEPVYPGPATPEQLNRGGSSFDRPHYQFTNLKAAKKAAKFILKLEMKLENIK